MSGNERFRNQFSRYKRGDGRPRARDETDTFVSRGGGSVPTRSQSPP